jgi:hypothetical protein
MKVLRCSLAAAVGVLLRARSTTAGSSSALSSPSDASGGAPQHLNLRGGDAAVPWGSSAAEPLPFESERSGGDREAEEERGLPGCVPVTCGRSPGLHVRTSSVFLVNEQRCDGDWYRFVLTLPKTRTFCASAEPTVLVLAHLQDCAAAAGSIGTSRRGGVGSASQFAEREGPYTVWYWATRRIPLTVKGRVLGPSANYTLNVVIIKDPAGCVSLVQDYRFTVKAC